MDGFALCEFEMEVSLMKKALAWILALAMALSLSGALAEEEATLSYPFEGASEPLTIYTTANQWVQAAGYTNQQETELWQTWQEQTGIQVEITEFVDFPAMVLALSAGEYPDVVLAYESFYNGGLTALIEDEVAIDLTDYAEYMPDYLALINSREDYSRAAISADGGIYTIRGCIAPDNITTHWLGMTVRQDYLDAVGMDVPTTNEEFYQMLVAFRDELGCTIPLSSDWWDEVLLDYGFCTTEYGLVCAAGYQVDGQYHYGAYEEEYRDVLGYLNQLYNEGLLDPNFNTTDEATSQANLLTGKTGAHPTTCARINTISVRAEDENFQLVGVGSLNGSDGTNAYFAQTDTLTPPRAQVFITADCDQPEAAVAFFNYLYTPEGDLLANYGPQGLCWEYNEEGIPTFTEYMTNNENGLSLDNMLRVQSMEDLSCSANDRALQRFAMPEQRQAMENWDKSDARTYLLPTYSISDADLSTEATNLWTDIDTYISESTVKFINGSLNLEDDFDAYLEQLKAMGMDRYIEIQQMALDEYYGK